MTPQAIKALRQKRGWTQQQLAAAVGVALSSVARWESPTGKPPKGAARQTLQRLLAEPPAGAAARPGALALPPAKWADVERLMAQMGCPKDFRCVKAGGGALCKAQDLGWDSYLECLDVNRSDCLFSVALDHRYLCQCPLRVFLAKHLNR